MISENKNKYKGLLYLSMYLKNIGMCKIIFLYCIKLALVRTFNKEQVCDEVPPF